MKCKIFSIFLIFLCFLALTVNFVWATTYYVSSGWHLGSLGDNTYINFSDSVILSSVYPSASYWVFGNPSISEIGFQVENGNLTITDFFVSSVTDLEFQVSAPSGNTSVSYIIAGVRGEPSNVTGASSWSYEMSNSTVIISAVHGSSVSILVSWAWGAWTNYPEQFIPFWILIFPICFLIGIGIKFLNEERSMEGIVLVSIGFIFVVVLFVAGMGYVA